MIYIEGSVTQRRNSILAILRKSGLCVTEHLGLKIKSIVTLATDFNGVLDGVTGKSLCFLAHIFLNILISHTHFDKIWSYVFVSLNPRYKASNKSVYLISLA